MIDYTIISLIVRKPTINPLARKMRNNTSLHNQTNNKECYLFAENNLPSQSPFPQKHLFIPAASAVIDGLDRNQPTAHLNWSFPELT